MLFTAVNLSSLGGCGGVVPVVPVDPVVPPKPVPVDPVVPKPVAGVATYAASTLVVVGMPMAEARVALGVAPAFDTSQDDGTSIAEYATVSDTGATLWLDVHYLGATVIGRSRFPRAP